jgi:hypothetical protein
MYLRHQRLLGHKVTTLLTIAAGFAGRQHQGINISHVELSYVQKLILAVVELRRRLMTRLGD